MSALQPPKPGVKMWETTHGVKMRMPTASYPYYRLDYRLEGVRRTLSAGKDWAQAWAEANRIDALVAADCGIQGELTVRQLAEAWYSTGVEDGWSATYRQETRRYLDTVILPGVGGVPIASLDRARIRTLLNGIASDSVASKVRAALGSMLSWAEGEGGWLSVGRAVLMPPARKKARATASRSVDDEDDPEDDGLFIDPAQIPDAEDVLALYEVMRRPRVYASKHAPAYTPPEWMAMMPIVSAVEGLRQAECFGLRGRDVKDDVLKVARQVQLVDGELRFVLPKMGKRREVILSPDAFGIDLVEWMNQRAHEVGPNGLIFPTPTGRPWRRSNYLADSFTPARMAAWGGLKWSFHSLRHHAATRLLQLGNSVTDVSLMLGHSSPRITFDMYVGHQASAFDRIRGHI